MKKVKSKREINEEEKNFRVAYEFYCYCRSHPELRFWQALRAWSEAPFILYSSHFDVDMFDEKWREKNKKTLDVADTFYWSKRKE